MHKILIVDDEKPARDFVAELIAPYIPDSVVTKADSAGQALKFMEADDYDLLIVDIEMPVMNGLEFLTEIKNRNKQPYTIIISAHRNIDYTIRGYELGVARFIFKPSANNPEGDSCESIHHITKPLYDTKIKEAIHTYINRKATVFLDLKVRKGVSRVKIYNIAAIEAVRRGVLKVYLVDEVLPEVTYSLSQLRKLLPSYFFYINRRCIVNLHHVRLYNPKTNAQEVSVICRDEMVQFTASRKYMRELRSYCPTPLQDNDAI
ncbi:MAG: response regulator [Tannerella sp.]|jgi:DNA-binding LytR/AlgR family response regulator|nr:response regulator [Tannerella sp.]